MSEICEMTAIIAMCSAFIILLIGKLGLRDTVVEHSKIQLLSEMFSCDFCLSFWLNFLMSVVVIMITIDVSFIIIPVVATPITRMLI